MKARWIGIYEDAFFGADRKVHFQEYTYMTEQPQETVSKVQGTMPHQQSEEDVKHDLAACLDDVFSIISPGETVHVTVTIEEKVKE